MYATDANGQTIYRLTPITTNVEAIQEGDLLFEIPIRVSEPQTDYIWRIQGWTEDDEQGIELLMTEHCPVLIERWLPLLENQCIDCGRMNVKYAARHQCSACYQREHRRTARKPSRHNRVTGESRLSYAS